jgi:hypothetical protein
MHRRALSPARPTYFVAARAGTDVDWMIPSIKP